MSKLYEMMRQAEAAREVKPRKPYTRSRQAALPRYRIKVLVDQSVAETLPPTATKIATLIWAFCKTECFVEVCDNLNTLYTLEEGYNDKKSVHLAAKMWNYGLQPSEVVTVLISRYMRWLEAEENTPLIVTYVA